MSLICLWKISLTLVNCAFWCCLPKQYVRSSRTEQKLGFSVESGLIGFWVKAYRNQGRKRRILVMFYVK